jgi:hypothetical protein
LCVCREINIPFGAIMELINKTQDKWMFLGLWKLRNIQPVHNERKISDFSL